MLDQKMLTLKEAKIRARKGAEELEGIINQVDKTPEKRDKERYAKLETLFMSLLAERFGIAAPDDAKAEIDSE